MAEALIHDLCKFMDAVLTTHRLSLQPKLCIALLEQIPHIRTTVGFINLSSATNSRKLDTAVVKEAWVSTHDFHIVAQLHSIPGQALNPHFCALTKLRQRRHLANGLSLRIGLSHNAKLFF